MADESTGLGKLIEGDKGRDAVHVAIAPVTANENLRPGQKVLLVDTASVIAAIGQEWDGIVDPFLTATVLKAQRFWMWMRPGSITSLRHDWTHPAFEGAAMNESRQWIEDFADQRNCGVDELMDAARRAAAEDHGGWTWIDNSSSVELSSDFWRHFETATGTKVPADRRAEYFTCSC